MTFNEPINYNFSWPKNSDTKKVNDTLLEWSHSVRRLDFEEALTKSSSSGIDIIEKIKHLEMTYLGKGLHGETVTTDIGNHKFVIKYPINYDATEDFVREFRSSLLFDHRMLRKIYNLFFSDNFLMIMEYVEGTTLSKTSFRKIDPLEMIRYCKELLDLFEECVSKGLVLMEIKPEHIFILPNKDLKIIDTYVVDKSNPNSILNAKIAANSLCESIVKLFLSAKIPEKTMFFAKDYIENQISYEVFDNVTSYDEALEATKKFSQNLRNFISQFHI